MKKVAVAIISRNSPSGEAEYLLIKNDNPSFGKYSGYYYPPGGHVEENESEEQALDREMLEELNLKIRPIENIATTESDIPGQQTSWWKCTIQSGVLEIKEPEKISDASFFTLEMMSGLPLWPSTKHFFEKYSNQK